MKKTSIVILSYNTYEYTKLCIDSIRKYTEAGTYEIIVIDNASTDGSVSWLEQQKDLRCIYNKENLGFPKGCNQGMKIASGSEILLLNSDTIVTPHWLEQLVYALYSDEKIGAVSCVTNSCSNMQQIEVPYKDLAGLFDFAKQYNRTDEKKWEKRLRLVGFCFLLKYSVYEKIGGMDEIFTPGNYEDDDYSLRIWEAGYSLLLCKDTFIHHFGSMSFQQSFGTVEMNEKQKKYADCLKRNFELFSKKWGLSTDYCMIKNMDIIDRLPVNKRDAKILEIGCGCGQGLLYLKNLYPEAEVSGVEMDKHQFKVASFVAQVQFCENIEKDLHLLLANNYDFIIMGDIMGGVSDPQSFETMIETHLADNGKIFFKYNGQIFSGEKKSIPDNVCLEDTLAFITWVTDEKIYQESRKYIEQLILPEGIKIQILPIRNCSSIEEAYSLATHKSKAKYKVYIQQDIRIIHRDFIKSMLSTFKNDPSVGMLGILGYKSDPVDGSKTRYLMGAIYSDQDGEMKPYKYGGNQKNTEVMRIDNRLIATQYDIVWHIQENFVCKGLYGKEIKEQGYKIVVLGQEMPWCIQQVGKH
ncbi:MAG: glycosyltransferase [Selenomonadaceae bacterium]